jgi:hypothetical protein
MFCLKFGQARRVKVCDWNLTTHSDLTVVLVPLEELYEESPKP